MVIAPKNILLGSLIGDALALGPHWIYDPAEIHRKLGRVTTYQPPLAIYHQGKSAGDLTHYGDQTLILLRSIAALGHYDLTHFAAAWRAFWENPATHSYRDSATKSTLAHLQAGAAANAAASSSHEIAGAARIAPLFLLQWTSPEKLIEAVRSQTAFTHANPATVETAEFFTRVILAIQSGSSIKTALEKAITRGEWEKLPVASFDLALESALSKETDARALHRHGLSCSTADAFPGICHLLLRHSQDPATALIENINAGGDSAARGMILGLVYGAISPISDWPASWLTNLNARTEVESYDVEK
jgi:ADP-ribosylglycohydrolase